MTRRLRVPFSLSRKRVRASFNKYNVYNAMTWRKDRPQATQYRQLFFAKQESRAYHGDRLTERQFKQFFRGEQPVLTSLAPKQSQNTGSEKETPFGLLTYVSLERRLDFAVFRALFASSIRQAAAFILKGAVTVNGVRMRSPGYELRPGDMFSVEPERVLHALGRKKPSVDESVKLTNRIIKKYNKYLDRCRADPEKMHFQRLKNRRKHRVYNQRCEAQKEARTAELKEKLLKEVDAAKLELTPSSLLKQISANTFTPRSTLTGTISEIQQLSATPAPAAPAAPAAAPAEESATRLNSLLQSLSEAETAALEKEAEQKTKSLTAESYDPSFVDRLPPNLPLLDSGADPVTTEVSLPFSPSKRMYGLAEPEKPFFTPWVPRQFLAPFAVLPFHLEICFESCHAVYLRDPVAKPGLSEVISPFGLDIHERAYLWYVARRRKNLPRSRM